MDVKNRYIVVLGIITIGFLFLIIRLSIIQIFSSKYKNQADQTIIYRKNLEPSRGMIYDRNNKLLIANDPVYELNAVYNEVESGMDTTMFCDLLGIDKENFSNSLNKNWNDVRFQKNLPYTFLSGIDPNTFVKFQEHLFRFPGFYPVLNFKRKYVYPHAAHALGYIGEVSNRQIIQNSEKYSTGDYVGISGIEKKYDEFLRGEKGVAYIFKDNLGREVDIEQNDNDLIKKRPVQGKDLISTIDIDLQEYAEDLLKNKKGSVVAIEPKTGEILTIVSSPTYDPNSLSIGRNRSEAFSQLQSDSVGKPLLDRSIIAQYPPGSIFKPILSLIALQEKVTYANRTIECTGVYEVNKKKGYEQKCRDHPTPYNISIALEHSCNTYYYKLLAETVDKFGYREPSKGLRMLNGYLDKFGMGRALGSDIGGENNGFIPTPEYYDYIHRQVTSGWRSSYILSLGIGQGEIQMTTLQMANLAAILANRGYYKTPHLIKSLEGDTINSEFSKTHSVEIDEEHFGPVLNGMERVMRSGSGRFSYNRKIKTCGKTGTSQNPFGEDHSVFFAFAPKDDPQIAIAVYVENAGGGGAVAAPIGSLIIEKYIDGKISPSREYLANYVNGISLMPTP